MLPSEKGLLAVLNINLPFEGRCESTFYKSTASKLRLHYKNLYDNAGCQQQSSQTCRNYYSRYSHFQAMGKTWNTGCAYGATVKVIW